MVISKGTGSDELVFTAEANSSLTMKLESNTFVIQPTSVGDKTASGYAYTKRYEGSGSFVNSKLNLTLTYSAKTDQATVRSELTVSGPKQ